VTGFDGFPEAALDFYDDLETDNTKSFWTAHKDVYETAVKAPMVALLAALEPEFGPGKVFRPYRDVRYAKDKTPYKTHQGGFVTARLGRFRDSVADDRRGRQLEAILGDLVDAGWVLGGDRLKTTPRGYDPKHPRIALLRHKTLTVSKSYGFEPVIHTPELLDLVVADWKAGWPLIDWLSENGVS
jgi:uncharacterized protein (DUF2461 family)